VGDAVESARLAPFCESVDDPDHAGGIAEIEVADLHGARAREEVLDDVLRLHDAAAADDRDLHALRALMDHAQDDGLDSRPRDSAVALPDAGAERLGVDLEAQYRVRDGDRVAPALLPPLPNPAHLSPL